MAQLDVLTLGPFVFDAWSTPEKLPFGGRQKMHVHRMPGGARSIDCMGPDDIDRIWSGTLWGDNALSDALLLDSLRRSGEELPFSNGVESRTVVILEFLPMVRKFTCIEYSIICTVADNDQGGGGGGGLGLIEDVIGVDLGIALDIAGGFL